ncbi:hypothetical protein A5788_17245 [Gordonia sp. 852002-50816_SCH5313054-c]|uniref:Uncharacterized protein n=1 Tax=Gordonia jacobaea TaxID=122202 RepID=A0ABR5IDI0_9ACTN|nr:hypothetical protein ABW18_10820 [Gordonia jacobaea]OBC03951.1 hypothetical protein A5786_12960 [Gordonia sp. 852002-50816_SCH5313054-a]OBC14388.1 hypothetical protein A5788_17245 [Gordonia sp. 852002-50816_SCH5313054-c]
MVSTSSTSGCELDQRIGLDPAGVARPAGGWSRQARPAGKLDRRAGGLDKLDQRGKLGRRGKLDQRA